MVCLLFAAASVWAGANAEGNRLPTYRVLDCKGVCGKWTAPERIEGKARYPRAEQSMTMVLNPADAMITVGFTVTKDGTVKDPYLIRLLGPQSFADATLTDVLDWRFKPATLDGVAVDAPNFTWSIQFFGCGKGARPQVFAAYDRARALLKENKYAEANAELLPLLSLERFTFYERAMVSLLLADGFLGLTDYDNARLYITEATLGNGLFLDERVRSDAIRARIRLEAAMRQYGDALAWYEILKKANTIAADDPVQPVIDRIRARLDDPAPLTIAGRIPPRSLWTSWRHTLLRRVFAFPRVDGKVDRFVLRCDQAKLESAISTTAEWRVPEKWSGCELEVYGEEGATFTLVEANP